MNLIPELLKSYIIYLDDNFNIVDKSTATIVKIVNSDGIKFGYKDQDKKSVKKNYPGPTIRSRHSGRRMTLLAGVGNASSRLAQNQRLKSTNGKHSQD